MTNFRGVAASLVGTVIVLAACAHGSRVAGLAPASAPRSVTANRAASLVGVWRVVKFCSEDSTGKLSDVYGANPVGYFVYAPSGQLAIQMMRTPPVPPFARGDRNPTDAERREIGQAYLGYFGTYTITSDSTVVHHVEGGTLPSYIGTDQHRVYRIRGDTLTIGGSRDTWACRTLLRVA